MQITDDERTTGAPRRPLSLPVAVVCLAGSAAAALGITLPAWVIWTSVPHADIAGLAAATVGLPFNDDLFEMLSLVPLGLALATAGVIALLTARRLSDHPTVRRAGGAGLGMLIVLLALVAGALLLLASQREATQNADITPAYLTDLLGRWRTVAQMALVASPVWAIWAGWAATRMHRIDEANRISTRTPSARGRKGNPGAATQE